MRPVISRIMNKPEDYKRMGTSPDHIEMWEDGRRDDDSAGHYEWWYFDMILDDGSKAVIHFNTKDNTTIQKDGTLPSIVLKITSPDGKEYKDNVLLEAKEASFGTDKCDVRFGKNYLTGDLFTYHIHVEKTSGEAGTASSVGADLTLVSTSKPWRPGAGGFVFGKNEDGYFTWLCAVPRGKVAGTLYYNGAEHTVTGAGYHDHQWGNMPHNKTWDHWIWGRQDFGDYAAVIFDIGTQKKFGYKRFSMMFLEDNDGNLVMEDLNDPECIFEEEYKERLSGKMYPKKIRYTYKDHDKSAVYVINQTAELESRDPTIQLPKVVQLFLKLNGMHPSTSRNLAEGTIRFLDGSTEITRSGQMIYEFVYMGTTVKEKMERQKQEE